MLIEFASSEAVSESFMEAVVLGVTVVSAMAITAFFGLVGKQKILAIRVAGGLILLGAVSVLIVAYLSNYGRFISVEVSSSGAKLVYPGPFGKEVFVPSASVKNVFFGLPGKTERKKDQCKILKSAIADILKT